jgi:tRNA-Thr(GGU) m(6)t(6)A37 methyltransferase TsaA
MPAFARLNRGSVTNSALGPAAGSRDSRPEGNRPKDSGPNNDGPKNDGSMTNDNSNPQYGPTQSADPFGLRKGEVAVELPDRFDASIYFIGRIRTPWNRREDCPKNGREAEAVCTIELDPRWAQGLAGLETTSHVVVLYWMDRARRDLVLQAPRHYGEQRGTFALRSPVRPNPIAMSVARLLRIEGAKLSVVGLDCLDNTPLLDIKPYFASTDAVADARVGWHATREP